MTPEQQKEELKRYAFLKGEIARLEDEIDMLKPTVEEIVALANPIDKIVETDFGTFSLVPKRKYIYSEGVQLAEKALKETKKNEEATGVATYVENPYVLFKATTIN